MKPLRLVRSLAIPLAVIGLLAGLRPGAARSAPAATARFEPAFAQVRPARTVSLEVWIAGVENLDRLEFTGSYEPAALEPLDALPRQEGIQMAIGPIFTGGYVPQNQADSGTLRLVACRSPADDPFSGDGLVATIRFRVRDGADPGSYAVRFDAASLRLLDRDGRALPVGTPGDAVVRVPPVTTALRGLVTREGTTPSHGRAAVSAFFYPGTLVELPPMWARACTAADGTFFLPVPETGEPVPDDLPCPVDSPPAGPIEWTFVRLDFANHLSECYWEPLDDEVVDIGWHVLQGGDVNADGCIDIYDIVRIISGFGQMVPSPCVVPYAPCPASSPEAHAAPAMDINGDCRVNIFDLTVAARNFGLCSSCR